MIARPAGSASKPRFVRAAGGVVWRDRRRQELAVIYRDRHVAGECCLPKGKLERGEGWEGAAVREVREETGCVAEVGRFAGLLHYYVRERPKVVVYFEMFSAAAEPFVPSQEVRAMAWLPPDRALRSLTHEGEAGILRGCVRAAEQQ